MLRWLNHISRYQNLLTAVLVMVMCFTWYGFKPVNPTINQTKPQTFRQFLDEKITDISKTTLPNVPKIANCHAHPCIALTFDDGPDGDITPMVLSALERGQAVATFFIIGSKVAGHELILQRMQNDGYEIGNHTWSHANLTKLTAEQIKSELDRTNQALIDAHVNPAHVFRPPYGYVNKLVQNSGWPVILWNTDPRDWSTDNPQADINDVVDHVRPGAIIIMHDTKRSTATALPEIIKRLKQQDYRFVTIGQLLQLSPDAAGSFYSGNSTLE